MKQAPVLTERDTKRVLQHVARGSFPERNRCIMMLSWLAGMRIGEIAALEISDVLKADGEVRDEIQLSAAQTKGRSARTVLINSQLKSEIALYIARADMKPSAKPLFTSKTGKAFSANGLCQRVLQLYDAAGVDRATTHSGRRTFCTRLAERGTAIHIIAALAGHRNVATTMVYLTANETMMRAAVEMSG